MPTKMLTRHRTIGSTLKHSLRGKALSVGEHIESGVSLPAAGSIRDMAAVLPVRHFSTHSGEAAYGVHELPPFVTKLFGSQTSNILKDSASKLQKKGYSLVVVADTPTEQEQAPDPYDMGRKAVEALTQAEGGALSRAQSSALLKVSIATLYNWVNSHRLVVWTDPAGRYQFPKWQFGPNGVLPGIRECLKALDSDDHWAVMRFFLTPSEAFGATPLALLRAGKSKHAVSLAASLHGSV